MGHIQADAGVFSNSQGFIRSQERIMWSGGHPWQDAEKDHPWLTRRVGWRIKRGWNALKGSPWHHHQKTGQLTQWEGAGWGLMQGNGQIWALTAWGPHVVHSGPQRHSTGGLPHFQVPGWGREASLLLGRSKTKWPLTASNLLQSTWPWELLFTSNACFYLHFLQS